MIENKINRIGENLLGMGMVLFVSVLFISLVSADLDLQIQGSVNGKSSTFIAQTSENATDGFDTLDLSSATVPSNYTRFYSRICSGSGNTCLLGIDSWDASENPRVLNLSYFASPAVSGTLNFSWTFSNDDFDVILKDYGSDSSYATQTGSDVNLSEDSNYTIDVSSMSFRYVTLEITNQSAVESSSSGSGSTSGSSSSSSGSSGGGGGTPIVRNIQFIDAPSELSFSSIFAKAEKKSFKIKNKFDRDLVLEIVIEGLGGYLSGDTQIILGPGEEREIEFNVAPLESGLLTGNIDFYWGDNKIEVPVVLNVRSENFLFDAGVSISQAQRKIVTGENLKAQVNLLQVGPKEKVDVTASYIIKDFSGNSYLEDSETFFVLESKEFVKEFHTDNLPPGKYILGLEISYPGAFATSSVQFEVLEPGLLPGLASFSKKAQATIIASIVIVLSVIGSIVWAYNRKAKIKRSNRR